ncbi:hypothetical protein BC835DRAFT_1311779, partial [Cytidiella melzeri]
MPNNIPPAIFATDDEADRPLGLGRRQPRFAPAILEMNAQRERQRQIAAKRQKTIASRRLESAVPPTATHSSPRSQALVSQGNSIADTTPSSGSDVARTSPSPHLPLADTSSAFGTQPASFNYSWATQGMQRPGTLDLELEPESGQFTAWEITDFSTFSSHSMQPFSHEHDTHSDMDVWGSLQNDIANNDMAPLQPPVVTSITLEPQRANYLPQGSTDFVPPNLAAFFRTAATSRVATVDSALLSSTVTVSGVAGTESAPTPQALGTSNSMYPSNENQVIAASGNSASARSNKNSPCGTPATPQTHDNTAEVKQPRARKSRSTAIIQDDARRSVISNAFPLMRAHCAAVYGFPVNDTSHFNPDRRCPDSATKLYTVMHDTFAASCSDLIARGVDSAASVSDGLSSGEAEL